MDIFFNLSATFDPDTQTMAYDYSVRLRLHKLSMCAVLAAYTHTFRTARSSRPHYAYTFRMARSSRPWMLISVETTSSGTWSLSL